MQKGKTGRRSDLLIIFDIISMRKTSFTNVADIVYNSANGEASGQLTGRPGDFILVKGKTNDLFSKFIRFGQALRSNKPYSLYTHAAVIVDTYGNLLEATSHGIRTAAIQKYIQYDFVIVHINASDADRVQAVAFAKACENDGYGWITLVSIALSLLTGLKFSFGFDGEEICSGLVASCLFMCGQWMTHDPSHVTPALLAQNYL